MNRRKLIAGLGLAPFAGGMVGRGASASDNRWRKVSPRERIRERFFPNLELITHEGKKVRFYDDLIKDKIVVINFMYATCEGVCPTVMTNLARVQATLGERIGKDIFIYSITLKPAEDTPDVLKEYARMHGIKKGWTLLTGKPADIEHLRRKLGFYDLDPEVDRDVSSHIGGIRFGNEPKTHWSKVAGMAHPDWIVRSILTVDWAEKAKEGGAK